MKKENFDTFLADRGLKRTKERGDILEEIRATEGHFAPDELFLKLRSKGSKVSRASIYRTLPLLVESGLIEIVEHVDKHAHYEKVSKSRHHDHMICTVCGKITEFYSEDLETLQERLCAQNRFRGMRHCLEIFGTCNECAG
jgi:Fur family transcriptional regulator, ferric uptake regulator